MANLGGHKSPLCLEFGSKIQRKVGLSLFWISHFRYNKPTEPLRRKLVQSIHLFPQNTDI